MQRVTYIRVILAGLLYLSSASVGFGQGLTSFLGKSPAHWTNNLSSTKPVERRSAAFALGKMGANSLGAVPQLVKLLQSDPEPTVREASAFALGDICRASGSARINPQVMAAFRQKLTGDGDPLVRRSCAFGLACMGPKGVNALDDLNKASKDSDGAVRQSAAFALGNIGKAGVLSLKNLLTHEFQKGKDPLVIRDAAAALGRIGLDAAPAIPELVQHAANTDAEVRKAVLAALVPIVDDSHAAVAGAPLKRALGDTVHEVKRNAAFALGNMGGKDAVSAVDVLIEVLQKDELAYKRQAASVLGNIGPGAVKAAPVLHKLLEHPDNQLAIGAIYSLGGIKHPGAIKGLVFVAKDGKRHWSVRKQCGLSLYKLAPFEKPQPIFADLANIAADTTNHEEVRAYILSPLFSHDADVLAESTVLTNALKSIIIGPRKKNNIHNLMRYNAASLMGIIQQNEAGAAVMETLEEFLKDTTMQRLQGTSGGGGGGTEGKTGGAKVETTGAGDGRTLCVQVLREFVGQAKVKSRPGLVTQLRALAAGKGTSDKAFIGKCKELLSKFGL